MVSWVGFPRSFLTASPARSACRRPTTHVSSVPPLSSGIAQSEAQGLELPCLRARVGVRSQPSSHHPHVLVLRPLAAGRGPASADRVTRRGPSAEPDPRSVPDTFLGGRKDVGLPAFRVSTLGPGTEMLEGVGWTTRLTSRYTAGTGREFSESSVVF